MHNLSQAEVRELFEYNQETGALSWRVALSRKTKIGSRAGFIDPEGYVRVRVRGVRWAVHRIAWVYIHGTQPQGQIDHLNGDRADNRLINLRDVPSGVNTENQRRPARSNTHGFLGVTRQTHKWLAKIQHKRKAYYLGLFDTPEEAHAAYVQAKRLMHAGCTI